MKLRAGARRDSLYLVNLVLLRVKGRTTFGLSYKPGTDEYHRVVKLAGNRSLTITTFLTLVFIANLVYGVNRLMHLGDRGYARTTLLSAPIVTVLFFVLMLFIVRKQLSDNRPGKRG